MADNQERAAHGREWFKYITTYEMPLKDTPFTVDGIQKFVMPEVWSRPGLSIKERRLITLACAVTTGVEVPIRSHVYSAMNSGDLTLEEMHEFTLQFAVYGGFALASLVNQVILDTWERIQKEGGPLEMRQRPEPRA